jgi:hypothetical protein
VIELLADVHPLSGGIIMTIPAHRIETKLQRDGTLTLERLPFRAGQPVEVIILPRPGEARPESLYGLRGTPVRYERPTEPVVVEEWDALR